MNNIDQSRQEKSKLDCNIRELTQLLNKEKEINMKLQEEIKVRPSRSEYMAVRRQLRTVTKIAFNVQDEDDGGEGDEEEVRCTVYYTIYYLLLYYILYTLYYCMLDTILYTMPYVVYYYCILYYIVYFTLLYCYYNCYSILKYTKLLLINSFFIIAFFPIKSTCNPIPCFPYPAVGSDR